MYATIQKWGNSQAIRIPKGILEEVSLHENDQVEIKAEKGCITISKINKRHKTLKERLANYKGDYETTEWDTGEPLGKEVW